MPNDVFILSAVRTAIGSFGGSLKGVAPADLGAHVTQEALIRSKVDPETVGSNVVGHVLRTEIRDAYKAIENSATDKLLSLLPEDLVPEYEDIFKVKEEDKRSIVW